MAEIMTVLGAIRPNELGITMAHEHILLDATPYFNPPHTSEGQWLAYSNLTLENLGWVRQNWMSNWTNLRLDEEHVAITELLRYANAGGSGIIDPTCIGIGRDHVALQRIAEATQLHVVLGTGYYVDLFHPAAVASSTEQELATVMEAELTTGIDGTGVRAGFIGEVGTSYPVTDNERKVLRAAVLAANATGCAVLIHPGRHPSVPRQLIEIVSEAGLPLERLVLAHMERTVQDPDALAELAIEGCTLSFDVFGLETSMLPAIRATNPDGSQTVTYPVGHDMPSDAQRIGMVHELVSRGHVDRILLAQDMGSKHRLATYVGHGYDHILNVVKPWMLRRGITDNEMHTMLVDNPARMFTVG